MGNLSKKRQRFVDEYLVDLNATQAATRAGYSAATANEQGARLLANASVAEAIAIANKKRQNETQINANYVLNRFVEIDQMDAADILDNDGAIKPVSQWPKIWRQMISGIDQIETKSDAGVMTVIKKIKWPDKIKNLELLGRHVFVGAFNTKVELTGKNGGPVEIKQAADLTDEELAAELAKYGLEPPEA